MRLNRILLAACASLMSSWVVAGRTYSLTGRQTESVLRLKSGNTYVVSAEYIIPNGCALRIPEDVCLVFEKDVGISVEGTLNAAGTVQKPVQFVGKQARPEYWTGILMKKNSKVDLYCAVVTDAKIGLKIGGGCHPAVRGCSFFNNTQGIYFHDGGGTIDGCYVAKNSGIGLAVHNGPTVVSHCTITENGGCGVFVWQWGYIRLTDSIVAKNLSHGFRSETSFKEIFATGCIFENNREFDVKNDTDSVWDFRSNYWGEESTKVLKEKGATANLSKVEDKLDGHKEGIVDLSGFLLKRPKGCGATDYPGARKPVKRPAACEKGDEEEGAKKDKKDDVCNDSENNSNDNIDDSESVTDIRDVNVSNEGGAGVVEGGAGDVSITPEVEDEPQHVKPTPVPSKTAIARAVKVMMELCGDDVNAMRQGRLSNAELAKKLLSYVRKTDNTAVKFVLLRNAYRCLLQAKAVGSARKLFDKTVVKYGVNFAVEMSKSGSKNLEALSKNAKTAKDARKLQSSIDELSACLAAIKEADAALRKNPFDTAAQKKKAFNTMKMGDWPTALGLYAKAGGERGNVAEWELAAPEKRTNDFAAEKIGDYWWSVIESADEASAFFKSVSRHAAYWYRQALKSGGMSEMKTELVKKRIARVGRGVNDVARSEQNVDAGKKSEENEVGADAQDKRDVAVSKKSSAKNERTEDGVGVVKPGSILTGTQTAPTVVLGPGKSYTFKNQYIVPGNGSLEVREGVQLIFEAGSGMTVQGKLIVHGAKKRPVVFRGSSTGVGVWEGLKFFGFNGSTITYAHLSGAKEAINLSKAGVAIFHSTFFRNQKAIHSSGHYNDPSSLEDCIICENVEGVTYHFADLNFKRCTFQNNEKRAIAGTYYGTIRCDACIVVKNGGGIQDGGYDGLAAAHQSCIYGNSEFDVKCTSTKAGEFSENFWGDTITSVLKKEGDGYRPASIKGNFVDMAMFLNRPPKECGAYDAPALVQR